MSVLPEELIEHIIDVVQSEHPTATLHACSLVSHQFFPRSRHHIFSTLTLNLATEHDSVDVAEFPKILESPLTSTTLIPYIRALTMYFFEDSKFFTPLEILCKLAYAGINPTRLEIIGKISRVAVLLSDRAIPTFTASVTDLSLLLTDNVGLDELAAYICAFCALQSLSVQCSGPGLIAPALASFPEITFPRLRHLCVGDGASAVLDWMGPTSLEISSILVRRARSRKFWDCFTLFSNSVAAATVESLTFIGCGIGPESYASGNMQALRSLTLEYRMNPLEIRVWRHMLGDDRFGDTTQVIPTIRAFAACTGVRKVRIGVENLDKATLFDELGPWQDVDAALHEAWPHLVRVTLCRPTGDMRPIADATARKLREHLPLCEAAGILNIQDVK